MQLIADREQQFKMRRSSHPRLTLLVGPAGSGKTQICTNEFEKALQNSENLLENDYLFILPTAEHRSRIIDLILRRSLKGFFQTRITTIDRALKEFLKLGGFDNVALFEDALFSKKLKKEGRVRVLNNKVFVSPRRWEKNGIMRTTFIYWILTLGFMLGIPLNILKRIYIDVR